MVTVMLWLDGDGTLVSGHFCKEVWYNHVPKRFASKMGISLEHAQKICRNWYKFMDGRLVRYFPDFWEDLLGIRIKDLYKPLDPYPDVEEFLKVHNGERYIVTGVPEKYARIEFKKVIPYFNGMVTVDMVETHKADPEFFRRTCSILGCNPRDVVFVDDVPEFVMAARKIGVNAYLIDRENKREFDRKITSLMDLLRLLH